MEFNHFLSSYYPDTSYGADRHYADMLEQAVAAERLGYASVSIPEHHLMNILMNPAPLQMAIKVAGETRRIKIITPRSSSCRCMTCGPMPAKWFWPNCLPTGV